jgi:predicted enzyme related to lactoylglutathione lyase
MDLHSICHVEIRTRDLSKAKAFYSQVFDWKLADISPSYAMIDTGKEPAGGIVQVSASECPLGVCNYALVADCAATGRRAAEIGGRIIVPKKEVPGYGSFVDTIDPWGNELAFWQAAGTSPAFQGSGKNGFCWVELSAPDLDAAVGYYTKLLGWKFAIDMDSKSYAHTEHTGKTIGVGLLGGEMAKHMPGVTTYIDVEDLDASGKKIAAAGGRVVFGPQHIPGTGYFSMVVDPEGNRLAIFRSARP